MKQSSKYTIITLGIILMVGIVIFTTSGELFQGFMKKFELNLNLKKSPKNLISCTDSDGGVDYKKKGIAYGSDEVTKQIGSYDDSCGSTAGQEGLRSGKWIAEKSCSKKGNYVHTQWYECPGECTSGECIQYSIYETSNEAQEIGFFNENYEEVGSTMAVERKDAVVLVPPGYTELAKAHVEDLLQCNRLLSGFLGLPLPRAKTLLKIYISPDHTNQGFSVFATVFYKRSQENIDFDMEEVLANSPEGFLFRSGPNYCANTHELTHAFLDGAPLPSWANEGLAEYSQKINQPGSKDGTECADNGFYSQDPWGDGEYKLFPFSDLSEDFGGESGDGPKWYRTSMCFIEELIETYGQNSFLDILQRLRRYQENPRLIAREDGNYQYIFIERVLAEELGGSIYEILRKYGFEPEDYAPYDR